MTQSNCDKNRSVSMHSEEACENQSAQPEFNDDNDNQENGTNCDLDA